jgi:hypothetical protein
MAEDVDQIFEKSNLSVKSEDARYMTDMQMIEQSRDPPFGLPSS